MKHFVIKCIKNFLFNYKRPKYRRFIYDISKQYVNFFQNDQNIDMSTNGEYRFLSKFFALSNKSVFFDVGANVGDYTRYIIDNTNHVRNRTIHCFEPDSLTFKKLEDSFGGTPGVFLNHVAVSDSVGKKEMFINKEAPELNSFHDTEEKSYTILKESVHSITLDQYVTVHNLHSIDLLKVDVEGHELAVFKGAQNLLKNKQIYCIQFEFGNAAIYSRTFFKDIYDLFVLHGYTIYKIMPSTLLKVVYGPEYEKSTYSNFVALINDSDISNFV